MDTLFTKFSKIYPFFYMDNLLGSLLFFFSWLILLGLYCENRRCFYPFFWQMLNRKPLIRQFHDPDICKRVLACLSTDDLENCNRISPLKARALPNQRLVATFHIDNAFTTTDHNYHRHFRTLASQKISGLSADVWKRIAEFTHKLLRKQTGVIGSKIYEILLVPLVQATSLKISLHILFDHNPLELKDDDVTALARNINELWMESKQSFPSSKKIQSLQLALQSALVTIFPNQKFTSRETPMNLILPAYETLWRVVLRCFLEVVFRNHMAVPAWRPVLTAFLAKPTNAQFEAYSSETNAISVSFIVSEALRLYPPTRRVYRTFHLAKNLTEEIVAADIECCQRNPMIWSIESLRFVPMRWGNLSEEAREAFMPFSGRPFLCPAKQDFGPRMIGVLVAALADCITAEDWTLENDGKEEDLYLGQPLMSGREEYHSLRLLLYSACS